MKKKALALLLALTMMVTATVNVFAGNTTIEFGQNVYNPQEVGETFDVDIMITENQGFNTMQFFIKYDPEVIQAVEAVDGDYITFLNGRTPKYFLSPTVIDNQINLVPGSTNSEYEGKANNRDTAGEIGIIKLAALVDAFDENLTLKVIEDTGLLCTIRFKVVGKGVSNISIENSQLSITSETVDAWSENVADATVVVGDSKVDEETTTTTEATTEATTKSSSGSNGGSGGGNGSSNSDDDEETTAVEETTEATTQEETEATTQEIVAPEFNDIAAYPWAVDYINNLAAKGIVNGYADGSFKPADNVKRADFLIMIVNAIGADNGQEITENFDDVVENAYYYRAVGIAKELGIANGNGDGTFSPTSYITRQDMMIIAKKALEVAKDTTITGDVSVLDKFADKDSISAYAVESLAAMVEQTIVNGTGNNIEPKNNTTRAQAAVIISKILEKI